MYTIVITDESRSDIENAYEYLENKRSGQGSKFSKSLDSYLKVICSSPVVFPVKHKQVRGVRIKPYRYILLYKVTGKYIFIIQLISGERHPHKRKS